MTESTEHDLREDEDLTGQALAAYFEAPAPRAVLDKPGQAESGPVVHDGRRYVVLRNVNGVLAVYRVRPDGALKRLERWPAEIEAY